MCLLTCGLVLPCMRLSRLPLGLRGRASGTYRRFVAREVEPERKGTQAPRGCLLAFFLGVLLLAALFAVVALALRPMAGM